MVDIRDYPDLGSLEEWLQHNFWAVTSALADEADIPQEALDSIRLDEIVVAGEHGRGVPREIEEPLNVLYVVEVEGEPPTSETDLFNTLIARSTDFIGSIEAAENADDYIQPTDTMMEWFTGVETVPAPYDRKQESLNIAIPIREEGHNIAFSLTNREDIVAQETGIDRQPVEGVGAIQEEIEQASIFEYPEKRQLVEKIAARFEDAKEAVKDEHPSRVDDIDTLQIRRVVFGRDWSNDLAEKEVDPFDINIFIISTEKESGMIPMLSRITRFMAQHMVENMEPSPTMTEWAGGLVLNIYHIDNINSIVNSEIEDVVEEILYDILSNEIISITLTDEGGIELQYEPYEEEEVEPPEIEEEPFEDLEPAVTPIEEEELGEVEEEPEEEEPLTEEEILAEEYPEMPPPLRHFAIGDETIDVPIGKDSKKVQAREPYDFEKELMTQGPAGTPVGRIQEGIGNSMLTMRYGEDDPPSTFPRIGTYIKYRLLHEGPSFGMEMYRDCVTYSAYISTMYDARFVVGSYEAFTSYLYRLREVSERGLGPELIMPLSQQQAASRGLSTVPSLPTGEDAPWLERRQYYEVVEDNIHHEAWNNVGEYLYGEEE